LIFAFGEVAGQTMATGPILLVLGLMVFQQLHPQMAEKEDRKTANRLPMPSAGARPSAALGRLLLLKNGLISWRIGA
jgi:hypothetical protein